jgi:SAM-dependent methyltransferase
MPKDWVWDETLYLGSAPHYLRGRLPYAPGLAEELANALGLDGSGRLLDVGCGPGVVALALAHLFDGVVGVDPDGAMLAEAAFRANELAIENVCWLRARAEELTTDLGTFRAATFGQSFHWMDRPTVAAVVKSLLEPGGAFIQIADVKESIDTGDLSFPVPPYDAIEQLVRGHLGPVRRAGQGLLRFGTPGDEAAVLRDAGFGEAERLRISCGPPTIRSVDELVSWTFARSDSAPHLFGDRLAAFEEELRKLLHAHSDNGRFSEQPPDTEVFIWRNQ